MKNFEAVHRSIIVAWNNFNSEPRILFPTKEIDNAINLDLHRDFESGNCDEPAVLLFFYWMGCSIVQMYWKSSWFK